MLISAETCDPGYKPGDSGRLRDRLSNLRTFVQVATAQSIAGGAKQLFRTPSSVTRSLFQLEEAVQARLFDRGAKGIVLNTSGRIVLERATRIDDELGQAAAALTCQNPALSPSATSCMLFSGAKLDLLVTVADTRSLSAAAVQLGMTQSGVCVALNRMESALGQSLFLRTACGMVPTVATHRIIASARRVFAELRHLQSDLSVEAGDVLGAVVVGAIAIARSRLLPSAIAATLQDHRDIKVKTIEGPFQALAPAIRSGEIDVYIGHWPDGEDCSGLVRERLFSDQLAIVCGAQHPLARAHAVSFDDVLDSRWIMPWEGSSTRRLIEGEFRSQGQVPPRPSVETCDVIVSRRLLSAGEMLAAISREQYRQDLESGALKELPIRFPGAYRDVGLIMREGALPSAATAALIGNLRLEARREQRETIAHDPRSGAGAVLAAKGAPARVAMRGRTDLDRRTAA